MVWGILAGAGEGFIQGADARVRKEDQKIRREAADRASEQHEWWKTFADAYQKGRAWVDGLASSPDYRQYFTPQGQQGPLANPTGQGALPQSPNPPMGAGVMPVQAGPTLPQYAEGGAVQVPEQQMGPPAALPAQQMGPPTEQPQQPQMSRRDRYDRWYNDMTKYALLNGGLEGLSKFEEMENAASRRQILGYAQQAATMLNEGNVGEAMRAGNAALEVTPFDTGLKFVANDGKLYMQGQDGTLTKPLDTADLMGFVDQHMATPENYLDFKRQYESERSNKANEFLRGREADISQENAVTSRINSATAAKQAETYFQQFQLDKKYRERDTQVKEAQALASLIQAKAANQRAMQAIEAGLAAGWDPSEYLRLMSDAEKWSIESMEYLDDNIKEHMQDSPNDFNHLVSDTQYLMGSNPPGSITRETAARVSQYLRQPGGFDFRSLGGNETFAIERGKQSGRLYAVVNGRKVLLTPELEQIVFNDPRLSEMVEGGNKEQKAPPPEPSSEQASYTYQDVPEGEFGPPALPDAGPNMGPPLSAEQIARMRTPRAI